nr:immunoglobulin heavy chain junction region [Mus musculus]
YCARGAYYNNYYFDY